MKRSILVIAGFGALVVVVGLATMISGVIPIKASSGHWSITRWLLNFSMGRSVSTHAQGIKVPDLNDPRLVMRGAGHYETGCRACHGSPASPQSPIAYAMTPTPPLLPPKISEWEPQELFYIVKHGVKFTGMPAWPTQTRDDEVWSVVAFLLEVPEMDAAEYDRHVFGDLKRHDHATLSEHEGASLAAQKCARCHGNEGLGRGVDAFPRLAAQSEAYLQAALKAYAEGKRNSGIMEPVVAELDGHEIESLASFYAQLDLSVADESATSPRTEAQESIGRGQAIAETGVSDQNVPSCMDCHGPVRKSLYPSLNGQPADFLVSQLKLFRDRHRGGSEQSHLMYPAADNLTDQQMEDVANYYASLRIE